MQQGRRCLLVARHPLCTSSQRQSSGEAKPRGHWQERSNRLAFMRRFAGLHNLKQADDWQRVSVADVRQAGGGSLLRAYYGNSLTAAVQDLVEGGSEWQRRAAKGALDAPQQRRAVLEEVAQQRGITCMAQWAEVTIDDVLAVRGGSALLRRFSYSIVGALRDAYGKEEVEEVERMRRRSHSHWRQADAARHFMDQVADGKGVREVADWRRVGPRDLVQAGGSGLLRRHGNSVLAVLHAAYGSSYRGRPLSALSARPVLPAGYWQDETAVTTFLESLRTAYDLETAEDWLRLAVWQIRAVHGGGSFLRCYPGGLPAALRRSYPHMHWDASLETSFKGQRRSTQRHLFLLLSRVLPAASPAAPVP